MFLYTSSPDTQYLLTAIGLPPGSSTVHIYTETLHRTTQNEQYTEQRKYFGRVQAVPVLESYNRPASFQSVITSYLREYTWCDVKEGYSHQYNFIRNTLKVFIHIHNVTLLFNLPLVNYLYFGTILFSHIKKITIHFLWPHTNNCIPGSFYFENAHSRQTSLAHL